VLAFIDVLLMFGVRITLSAACFGCCCHHVIARAPGMVSLWKKHNSFGCNSISHGFNLFPCGNFPLPNGNGLFPEANKYFP
jgi:hypothetical protein